MKKAAGICGQQFTGSEFCVGDGHYSGSGVWDLPDSGDHSAQRLSLSLLIFMIKKGINENEENKIFAGNFDRIDTMQQYSGLCGTVGKKRFWLVLYSGGWAFK